MAEEGVNGTISGYKNQVESLVTHLRSWPERNDFEVKYSTSLEQNFNRMKVKIKNEIVTMGEAYIDAATDSGQYVDPKDWNQLISRDDVLIVDTRNTYEVSMGRFDGATNPSFVIFQVGLLNFLKMLISRLQLQCIALVVSDAKKLLRT